MRRCELLLSIIRQSVEIQKTSGDNDSLADIEILQYLNDGQDRIYSKIVNSYSDFYKKACYIDLVAGQEEYGLAADSFLGSKIKSVEWKFASGNNDYRKIFPRSLHDRRTDFTSAYPSHYIRLTNSILINPLPSVSLTNGLRVVYARQIRRLDIRRGEISDADLAGGTITLDLTPSLTKDAGMVDSARDLLNSVDYICVVDSDGYPALEGIPISSYDPSTGIISLRPGYSTEDAVDGDLLGKYVVTGKYTSTHSELPEICERYLMAWVILKLLRRTGNQFETKEQKDELAIIEADILESFAAPDDDIRPLPVDRLWDDDLL